ncbi:hypothetical protein HN419_04825 [Candidatus Woesearchaeota archaeon]|jgi:hypothetical protein|nr:hypothetical protein [Candidatus Woesearchaeota archaeon]MBT3537800.1 hypothetical protein [Candidatus Woesearchaeota archaeon]MBT4697931.1 hypothetical protein [Candidatus Woesearchaeota archaeon]MBT4717296.1 hypothetical protein [Candidatus Woesearchaeota archaeon]MBT7105469.1 hypothetical protein [Candidatus Woesearchaeota archaeon]
MSSLDDLLKIRTEKGMLETHSKYVRAAQSIDEAAVAKKVNEATEGKSNPQQYLAALAREFYGNLGQEVSGDDQEVVGALIRDTGGAGSGVYKHVLGQISAGKFREAKETIGAQAAVSQGQQQASIIAEELKSPDKIKGTVAELRQMNPGWSGVSDEAMIVDFDRYAGAAAKAGEAYSDVGTPKTYGAEIQKYAA